MRHAVMYVLAAIVLLNVIAISLLSMRATEQEPAPRQPNTAYVLPKPEVAVLLLPAPDCPDCYDVRQYIAELDDTMNLTLSEGDPEEFRRAIAVQSRLVPNADRLPALAFNASIEHYPGMTDNWEAAGYVITFPPHMAYAGTWYVLPTLNAPYYSQANGSVQGRLIATYLTMESCERCSDAALFQDALAEAGAVPSEEIFVDAQSPEGAALIRKYNITAVPTLLLNDGARHHPGVHAGWEIVGTIEPDGTYVLRDLQRLQATYYDRLTGQVMEP